MKIPPSKIDPTRSITLRRTFGNTIARQFNNLRKEINKLIVNEDALGLLVGTQLITNQRWRFVNQTQKVEEFEKWLVVQVENHLLSLPEANRWRQFIQKGFVKGAARAFDDTSKKNKKIALDSLRSIGFTEGTREQFLRTTLSRATAVEKLKSLQARTLSDVKGMTDDLRTKAKRALTDGLTKGLQPSEIATSLAKVLQLSLARAKTIAYTELVRAHAEGQLEAMESMGIAEVGIAVEWSTAANPCKVCQPLKGIVLKISEARGMIPRHPMCRCAFEPANIGEDKTEQKRGKYKIDKAIKQSQKREGDSEWGPTKGIARTRPKSIITVNCCGHLEEFARLLETLEVK